MRLVGKVYHQHLTLFDHFFLFGIFVSLTFLATKSPHWLLCLRPYSLSPDRFLPLHGSYSSGIIFQSLFMFSYKLMISHLCSLHY